MNCFLFSLMDCQNPFSAWFFRPNRRTNTLMSCNLFRVPRSLLCLLCLPNFGSIQFVVYLYVTARTAVPAIFAQKHTQNSFPPKKQKKSKSRCLFHPLFVNEFDLGIWVCVRVSFPATLCLLTLMRYRKLADKSVFVLAQLYPACFLECLSANVKRSQPLLLIPFWLSSLKVLNKFGHSDQRIWDTTLSWNN